MISNVLLHLKRNADVTRTKSLAARFRFFAVLIVIAPLVVSTAAGAAVTTYTGSSADLQNEPDWVSTSTHNSLFPNISGTPLSSDNQVDVDYVAGGPGMTNPYFVFGGLSQSENSANNSVEILNGWVDYSVYGGYSQSGIAENNAAAISGGNISWNLYGGWSDSGGVKDNTVTVSGGTVASSVHGGGSDSGNVESNTVTISGGTVLVTYGGYSESGAVKDNTVTVSGGQITSQVYGGYSRSGDVADNDVDISGGTVGNRVIGGYSTRGTAENNTVTISGATVGSYVYGGYSQNSTAASNDVTINGANVGYDVYGGHSDYASAVGNTVTISDGVVSNDVFGAYGRNITESNTVTIDGGTVVNSVHGGYSDSGVSEGNIVTISGGTVGGYVLSGYSIHSEVENNTVAISGGTVGGVVYGGRSYSGNAINNEVVVSGGYLSSDVYGGYGASHDVADNTVTIDGGTVNRNVRGGYNSIGNVTNNNVTISSGDVNGYVYGGHSRSGDAADNAIVISGGEVDGDIIGGASVSGIAVSNSVDVSGGKVGGDIVGGYSVNDNATYNVVTISGSPILTTSYLYGGYTEIGTKDAFTGNTLNFKSSGISAGGVENFQYYNFYLPDGAAANDTMLSVTYAVDLNGASAEIYLQGAVSLQDGDKISLIKSTAGVDNYSASNSQVTAGAFAIYDFSIYSDANDLWAELISSAPIIQQSNILTDSRLAPLAFLNQGADLVASLEYLEVSGDKRFNTFAVVGGGSSTYGTGSGAEIDIDGFSMLAGVMWNAPVNKNSLIVSAFFEAGWGSYDTCRDFGADGVVRGSGDSDYYGGGLHMRYKWDSGGPGGFYAEASLRGGRNKSDFNTNDLATVSDFSYDSGSNYFGAHVGLGYVWQLSGKTRLEATSKYLWTRLGSDEVTASSGDRISFDSLNSNRWRTGFRMYHDYGNANAVTFYYGAAYEYEFGGDAEGRLGELSLDGSSLSGGSGIGELGVIFRPSKDNDRLSMQLGVQGYVGAREGISGTLKLRYAF